MKLIFQRVFDPRILARTPGLCFYANSAKLGSARTALVKPRCLRSHFRRIMPENSAHNARHGSRGINWTAIALSSTAVVYLTHRGIRNDAVNSTVPTTFERQLWLESVEEKKQAQEERKSNYSIVQYLYHDVIIRYVVDPVKTFIRFVELTIIFVPVILAYPISYLGMVDAKYEERSGALLWYRMIRRAMEMGSASFIKLGQWAGSRTDIFPRALCDELSELHSNAKMHSMHQTRKIVSDAFDMPFDEIFDEFVEKPMGVGAIAQVYVAKLSSKIMENVRAKREEALAAEKSRGTSLSLFDYKSSRNDEPDSWVAVKVIHPNVEKTIDRDLKIMMFFAKLIDLVPGMEWLSLPDEVDQFGYMMKSQLDLRIEGQNLRRFRENFKNRIDVKFPYPYLDYTSRKVLVEEYVYGVPISKLLDVGAGNSSQDQPHKMAVEVADKGLNVFLQMLILDNFIHGDLHPGNILVRFYKNEQDALLHKLNSPSLAITKTAKSSKSAKAKGSEEQKRNAEEGGDSNLEAYKILSELQALGDDSQAWNEKLDYLYQNGYHAQLCFLDVGLVTELNDKDRVNFIDLFRALAMFDGYKAGELMIERSRTPETAINKELFALKVERLVKNLKSETFALGNVSIGDLLDQMLSMVRKHHVRMEGDFVTVVVAILLLEGVGRRLDPQLDLFASAIPILRRLGLKDGKYILDTDNISLVKVWLALEVRRFIHASIQDIHNLVKYDGLSPNY